MKPVYKKREGDDFSRKEVVLYLQSLQLLQILEGASLDDADLVVFQMPRITEAVRVKDKKSSGILMPGTGHAGMVIPRPWAPSWDQHGGTRVVGQGNSHPSSVSR